MLQNNLSSLVYVQDDMFQNKCDFTYFFILKRRIAIYEI